MKNIDFVWLVTEYFSAQKEFWKMSVKQKRYGYQITSLIDKKFEYNFDIFLSLYKKVIDYKDLEGIKKDQVFYVPYKVLSCHGNKDLIHIFSDYWFCKSKQQELNVNCNMLSDIVFKQINNSLRDDLIYVLKNAYISNNENYKKILKHLKTIDFDNSGKENGYKIKPYIAYKNNKPVSMCVILNNGINAFLTRVCTIPEYRGQHIASNLIKYAISSENYQKVYLCTYTNKKIRDFYKKLEFSLIAQAKCFIKKIKMETNL